MFDGKQGVSGSGTFRDYSHFKAFGQVCGDILHGVDRDMRAAIKQRFLYLLYEKALAADFCQRDIENLVALGLDLQQFNFQPGVLGFQAVLDMIGLPESKGTASGGDDEYLH